MSGAKLIFLLACFSAGIAVSCWLHGTPFSVAIERVVFACAGGVAIWAMWRLS